MATQWSSSTPMLLVTQEGNGQYMHQAGKCQHNVGYVGAPEFYPPQVTGNDRFTQPTPCYDSGINIMNALGRLLFMTGPDTDGDELDPGV